MHGGRLRADSAGKNRGATFTVELTTIAAPAPTPRRTPLPHDASPHRPLNILLVEDHDATCKVLSLLLRQLNHKVTAAPTVADALKHAEAKEFDLLISDLGLPDGTGYDLMRELKERYQLTGIALSGYGMDSDIEQSRD